jgi:hypothetical protein
MRVIRCLNFGSLWWLRPGNLSSDPFRFSSNAAVFNTTGFVSGCRERRLWHVAGVVRINLGMHPGVSDADHFASGNFECAGLEHRGGWHRLLLGRRLKFAITAERVLLCIRSGEVGRIHFGERWHGESIQVIAGSALRGVQETLLLANPGATFQTEAGIWEVKWSGPTKR